jgi:predicted nucleic acid-binding protein
LAEKYQIGSWDGYIVSLMEEENLSVIYTLDLADFSKIEWINAVNPIDATEYDAYQNWLKTSLKKNVK